MSGDADDSKGAARPAAGQDAEPPAASPPEDAKPGSSGTSGSPRPGAAPEGSAAGPSLPAGRTPGGAKKRKSQSQRKTVKRKIKTKPKFTAGAAPSPAAGHEAGPSGKLEATAKPPQPGGKPQDEGAAGKAHGPEPAGDNKVAAAAAAVAVSASQAAPDSGRPIPPHAIAADIERSAASSEASERSGSGVAWLLVLLVVVVAGVGYWTWQAPGPSLEQKLEQRLAQAQSGVQGVIASITGRQGAPGDAAPAPGGQAQTEEVELPDPPALPLAQIAEMEELLAQLSFDPGDVDGIVDNRTREAIRRFQEMDGQTVDGEPSEELLAALREVAGFQEDGG